MSTSTNPMDPFAGEYARILQRRKIAFGLSDQVDPLVDSKCATATDVKNDKVNSGGELPNAERPHEIVGMALSGGGLRSALFNDGFLQALSHNGLLRYVDYLCSVSGGGYIAGHLMTHSQSASVDTLPTKSEGTIHFGEEDNDFHNHGSQWHLGRDPQTGLEDPDRLYGIGRYLQKSVQFFAGYVINQLPVFAFYLGTLGVFSVLLACGIDRTMHRSFAM
ncbi:MAG: patatin-like phospholipase family protein [Pirellulaceae bacterium]